VLLRSLLLATLFLITRELPRSSARGAAPFHPSAEGSDRILGLRTNHEAITSIFKTNMVP
jgi:hypothetical protein